MTINSQAVICILIIRFLLTFFNWFFGRIRDDTYRIYFNFFDCQRIVLRQMRFFDLTDDRTGRQINPIGLPHRQPLVLFDAEDDLFSVCFLQNDPALALKRNAGNRKTNAFLRAIAFVREHYIKLCAADAAEKQQQRAEDQKRPVAGERGNNSCSQKRQAEQQRQQPLLQQRRRPRKNLFHGQHRSKTICLCRDRFAIAAETGRACREAAIRIGRFSLVVSSLSYKQSMSCSSERSVRTPRSAHLINSALLRSA